MKFTAPDGFVINPKIENSFVNKDGEMIAVAVLEHNKFKSYDDENKKLKAIRTIIPLIPTGVSSTFKIENKTRGVIGYTSSLQDGTIGYYGYAIHYFLYDKIIQVMSIYVNKESARSNLLNFVVNNKKLKQYVQKDTSVSINKNSSGVAITSFMKDDLIYCLENIASISPNQKAVDALKKILLLTDENDDHENYYIIPCDGVSNFMALNYQGKKIILYNDFYVNLLFAKFKLSDNKWSHSSILTFLAHEIGHFKYRHAMNIIDGKVTTKIKLGDEKRKQELEADEYAGYIMAKDGKSLTELLRIFKISLKFYYKILDLLPNKPIVKTHPSLDLRVESITKGWNKFEKKNKKNKETLNIKLSNGISFNLTKDWVILNNNSKEAINKYVDKVYKISVDTNLPFAANYWDENDNLKYYMNIRVYPNFDVSQADINQNFIQQLNNQEKNTLSVNLSKTKRRLIERKEIKKKIINNKVFLVHNYRRTGGIDPNQIVNVFLYRYLDKENSFTLTLAFIEPVDIEIKKIVEESIRYIGN